MANGNVFDVTGSKNREFWFGHLVVLIATVMAVYLAASAGLKTAIEFELVKSDRDSYYMRTALLDEVKDNVQSLDTWGKEYRGGNARKFMNHPDDFKMDYFIWNTMKYNPGTFEIPGDILTGVRRYYRDADATLRKMTSKAPAAATVDQMLATNEAFKNETLQKLEANIAALRSKLAKHGIEE